jgi:AraC-like DNA-binding protein
LFLDHCGPVPRQSLTQPANTHTHFDGDHFRFERADRAVHPRLRGLVDDWFGYQEAAAQPVRRRLLPEATVTVYFGFGDPPNLYESRTGRRLEATPQCFVGGLHDSSVLSESVPGMRLVQVQLTPPAAYALFGVPMHELAGRVVDLADVAGRSAREIPARLGESPDWATRFALLDELLLAGLAEGSTPDRQVDFAWRALCRSHGQYTIAGLADTVGWSRRHLVRKFQEQIGLPPKTVARILRLRKAVRLLRIENALSVTDIAVACGYYDQAHLDLDFSTIVGTTPTGLLAEEAEIGRTLVADRHLDR